MKLVYLILAHKNPEQLARLVRAIHADEVSVFVHIDGKCALRPFAESVARLNKPCVHWIKKRVKVRYAGFSQVRAVFHALPQILASTAQFDYLVLLSGQDFPLKRQEEIAGYFQKADGREFLLHAPITSSNSWRLNRILRFHFNDWVLQNDLAARLMCKVVNRVLPVRRFPDGYAPFWGLAYWRITHNCAKFIWDFAERNPQFINFFRFASCVDEYLIPTIIMNSRFAGNVVNDDLTYQDWSAGQFRPKTLGCADFAELITTDKLFARKFDAASDSKVLDLIDAHLQVE